MYMISAPIAEDLIAMIAPYRAQYDPLAQTMPPHISILKPFEFLDPLEQLDEHLEEIGDTHSPIKVSIVGWDMAEQAGFQLRLPLIAGRQEFTLLRQILLAGPLSHATDPNDTYWPHIVFGRFRNQATAETAKESLKGFEPKFVFRVNHIELLERNHQTAAWQIKHTYGLNATVSGIRRRK